MRERPGGSDTLERTAPDANRLLTYAAVLYGIGLVAHTADHVRRGPDVLTTEVKVLGTVTTLAGLVVIGLVFARHRRAPLAAAALGFVVALGVFRTHLLPQGADAFPRAHHTGVTAFSWLTVLVELAGLLALGLAGVNAMWAMRRAGSS